MFSYQRNSPLFYFAFGFYQKEEGASLFIQLVILCCEQTQISFCAVQGFLSCLKCQYSLLCFRPLFQLAEHLSWRIFQNFTPQDVKILGKGNISGSMWINHPVQSQSGLAPLKTRCETLYHPGLNVGAMFLVKSFSFYTPTDNWLKVIKYLNIYFKIYKIDYSFYEKLT